MQSTRTQIATFNAKKAIIFSILFVLAFTIPAFIHSQWITGPLVNAILIFAVLTVGPAEAILLGMMPSIAALSVGLLPLPMAPMIPFIMFGNAILIMLIHWLKKTNFALALFSGATLKFLLLWGSVSFIISNLVPAQLSANLSVMMSWPQLFTALAGGLIAYSIVKIFKLHD
ncbi:hypothetical protein GF340_04725 [Candidatus Peregrinibacteria bacterium]|nr:hypothetical protein [Candidatus Peregrinibacteria bacterium]